MKFLNKSIYALSLVGMMGLWSCSQEEMVQGGDVTAKGHSVPVTLTVSRADAQTRTVLSENEFGGLNDVWVTGDVLHVYNKAGEEVGTLNLQEGEDTSVGVFSGLVNAEEGQQDLNLWYYGDIESNPNLLAAKYSGRNGLKVDLHTQNFADVKALSALDILSKGVTLNVNGEKSTVVKDETLEAHLAMARFSLKGLPEGSKGKLNIYNVAGYGSNATSGEEYYNTLNTTTLDFARLGKAQTTTDKKDIVVENVEAGKDVYVAFVPSAGYQLGFVFTNAADGKKYSYAFENKTQLEAGKYYTAFNEESGKYGAVEITLVGEPEEEVLDHSKNPLALWAESDLTRSGSGADAVGKFTGNYKTSGYFYQFGRNYGHQNYTVVNNNYEKIGVAKMNSSWTGGTFYTSLYGYVNGSTLSNVYNGSGLNQKAKWYSSTTNLASYPEYFLVAGNSNLQNWDGEAVFDTSIQHKHSWSERAAYYGYNKDVCPDGYRLPTLADWKKILPKGGHIYSGSSFATFSEIKEDGDVKYAVRWSRVTEGTKTQYLKIDALVIGSNVESTSEVNWSDENVVTRYFKAAGMIRPYFYLAKFTNQGVVSYQWLEKATPQGTINATVTSIGAVQVSITRDDSWLSGFYWVDDPNQYYMEFRFDASNLQEQGSFINVYQPEVPIACNIRCIKK
ncbi:MAG: fimbrillin family protein [Muribaculaceae bacterium]|nr:fimbrillin family protein [Muribaculaceae bacterium]